MTWYDHLLGFLQAVVDGESGQAGVAAVYPPDPRTDVTLSAKKGAISFWANGQSTEYSAKQVAEAVSAYVAAVEGSA